MPASNSVQPAVGVLLKKLEIGSVVLDFVGVQVAKDPDRRLFVHEKKAPEVGVEQLNSRSKANKIVVWAQVMQLDFSESLLPADVRVEAVGAAANVRADDAKLADI